MRLFKGSIDLIPALNNLVNFKKKLKEEIRNIPPEHRELAKLTFTHAIANLIAIATFRDDILLLRDLKRPDPAQPSDIDFLNLTDFTEEILAPEPVPVVPSPLPEPRPLIPSPKFSVAAASPASASSAKSFRFAQSPSPITHLDEKKDSDSSSSKIDGFDVPHLKGWKTRDVAKLLREYGFAYEKQDGNNHPIYLHRGKGVTLSLAVHARDDQGLSRTTAHSVRQAIISTL